MAAGKYPNALLLEISCFARLNSDAIDCERGANHEVFITNFSQSVEGSQGMCPRMCVGIYLFYRTYLPPLHSQGSNITHSSLQTSEAAEKCLNEKRKTLNGEDILTSMRALGFDNYEGVLRVYLAKYRDVSGCNLSTEHDESIELTTLHNNTVTSFHTKTQRATRRRRRGSSRWAKKARTGEATSWRHHFDQRPCRGDKV